jgi:enoyl-CoA hydratase/carnithine racemase
MIRLARDGDLWVVTLDRPDKANALTAEMLTELADIATAATAAKVLILTGSGRVFSAGADLDAARAGLATDPVWERVSAAIAALPGLTIAALNGTVAGGAFGMMLACDLRIAVPAARFFYPVMRLGYLPQPSDPARLAALIGPARARLVLLTGTKLTAPEALACGLIDKIAEAPDLMDAARGLATDALGATADHIASLKAMTRP